MQVTVETINPVTKKITIQIPAAEVDAEIETVYAGIQKKAKLQGFRPGKAPMPLIKRTYSDAMQNEVVRRFYEKTLFKALDEHKIEPVDSPAIEWGTLEQGAPFTYTAQVEIIPEIHLKDYAGLVAKKEKYVLNPESIEGEITRMQENMGQLVPLDEGYAVENGHVLSVDYTFSVEGYPQEDAKAEDAPVEVGANRLMPGLEEQMIGMKCGETKEIRVTLPADYRNTELAGKEGVFTITLKEIKRKELPELDDEFAQQFGDYETMEDLRTKMVEYHQKQESERIENELHDRIIKALIEKNPLEVPQALVKNQLEYMLENFKNRLKSQHMSIEMMGLDEEGFRKRFHASAEEKVKGGLLLTALVEKENISVSDEDVAQRYEKIAGGNKDMLGRVKEFYASNRKAQAALAAEIKEDKAMRFLIDNAVITEVEPAELKAA